MMLSLLAFVTLGVLIPFGLDLAPSWNTDARLLYGVLLLCSLRLSHLILRAEFRPIAFTFWIFAYVWGALAALLQVSVGKFGHTIYHSLSSQNSAVWLILLAFICFEAGYQRQAQFKTYPSWRLELDPNKVFYLGIIVAIWTLVHIYMVGGPDALMQHRAVARRILKSTVSSQAERTFRDASLHGPIFVYVLIVAHLAFSGLRSKVGMVSRQIRVHLLWLLAVLLPLHFIANYPNAQTRAWLGALVVAPALLFMPRQRTFIFAFIVGFIVSCIIVFPALDANRSLRSGDQGLFSRLVIDKESINRASQQLVSQGDYDVFQMFCNGIEYVEQNQILWGDNILAAALFWVPRAWWPDKGFGPGTLVGIYFGNPNVNLSSPLWMEFYMAFGSLGVVVLMFLYGRFAAYIDNRFQYSLETQTSTYDTFLILAVFWAGQQFLLLRGSLINGIATASFPILMILISSSWPRNKSQGLPIHPSASTGARRS